MNPVPVPVRVSFAIADVADAVAIATVRSAAAQDLTERFGRGYWSSQTTDRGVVSGMRTGLVLLARRGSAIVATARLSPRKPWAIDATYFTAASLPLYLTDMAVRPDYQRQGIGRALLGEATRVARAWPADALRLDAFNADAGASGFYARCGFRQVAVVDYRDVPLVYFEQPLIAAA
ncbi:MAG: GNAT family N-acetyltransferase [Gemmatimonadota bacterium]